MPRFGLWVSFAAAASTQAASLLALRSIDRVPESLKALLAGLEEESTGRMKVSHDLRTWCEDTTTAKKEAIEDAREAQEETTADLNDAESRRDTARQRVDGRKAAIRAADAELSDLEKDFDSKKAKFKQDVEELQTATGDVQQSLFNAHTAVRTQAGDKDVAELRSLDSALLRNDAPSFLQVKRGDAGEVQSAKDMEEAEAQLRSDWGEAQKEMGKLMKEKKQQIAQLESDLEAANLAVAEAEETAASLTRGKNAASRTESREQALLTTVSAGCESKKAFFASQDKLRLEAAAGIEEALDALGSLTQVSMTQFAASFLQLSDAPAAFLDTAISSAVTESSESGLDPLADIKAKIQGMVQALEAAANAEAGPDNFCSDEQQKNREKKRTKADDIDRLAAEARKKGFELDGLLGAQRAAQAGINSLSLLRAHVDSFATTEKSRLGNENKDHDLAVEVLDKAVSLVKSEFGLSLIQDSALSPQESAQRAVSAMTTANDKLRMLSGDATSFLAKLDGQGNTEIQEVDRAMRSEEQQLAESKSEEATKRDEISGAQTSEQTARAELQVVVTFLENLGQQCGPQLGNSYEELKRQREEEIAGLQDALKVLEGESVPSLSMAQVHPSNVQRAALALGVA